MQTVIPAEHTPTPWGIEQTRDMLWIGPLREDGRKVDEVVFGLSLERELTPAAALLRFRNVVLIVRAVNSHEALVEAGRELADVAGEGSEDLPDDTMVEVRVGHRSTHFLRLHQFRALNAALALAEQQP